MGNLERYRQKEIKCKTEGDKFTGNKTKDFNKSKLIKDINITAENISLLEVSMLV